MIFDQKTMSLAGGYKRQQRRIRFLTVRRVDDRADDDYLTHKNCGHNAKRLE